MWSSILASFLSLVSNWLGLKKAKSDALNAPEMVANRVAKDDAKVQDQVAIQIAAASLGDEKSLEDLRRAAAE